ncbi:uncharacterized protein LOC121733605 [Aricia agestis]|uniref:uncharacterized protein LOC121733605 n=1 Tax=Aricia agestis TaxID=91739 RepID=UPI001C20C11A|nr:uncharacterized protein LOC121733605 [Aricia agestis]
MRKTYRSKRDAPGALDHRDVMLNTDAKASLFDAFYIQNIKQTKKEASVCSMQFAASNRVRKRKYVKRVKEKTPPPMESMSLSAYLTPDKSIHLNRAPDLFDQLLNSSPLETQQGVYKEVKTHVQNIKTYGGLKKTKKINCWSSDENSDSDKENSITDKNTTDIKSHKLLVENKNSPKKIDESINNIFNNLSVFKVENCSPINLVQSPFISKVKNNIISALNTSPLCSTPFKEKYRGKSIYKFSPISTNTEKNKYIHSIVFENEEINETDNNNLEQANTSPEVALTDNKKDELSIIIHANAEEPQNVSCEEIQTEHDNDAEAPKHLSSVFETTEQEPFLGFQANMESSEVSQVEEAERKLSILCHNTLPSESVVDLSCREDNEISSTNATSNSISNESLYDTCSSEDSDDDEHSTKPMEPVILLDKLSDSIFKKYYKQMPNYNLESNNEEDKTSIEEVETTEDSNSTESDYNSLEDEVSLAEPVEEDNATKEIFNESIENNEITEIDNESNNDSSSNEDSQETCVSFVTTRRRNKARNDFTILTLDTSCTYSPNTLNNIKEIDEENVNCDNTINKDNKKSSLKVDYQDTIIEANDEEVDSIPIEGNVPRSSINKTDKHNTITTRKSARLTRVSINNAKQANKTIVRNEFSDINSDDGKPGIVLQPGKKWERSLSIYRRMTTMADHFDESILDREDLKCKGRKYRQSVICTMEMQGRNGPHNESFSSRRSTFTTRPSRPSIKLLKDEEVSRLSFCSTNAQEDLQGFLNEDWDDTVIELSKLSIADCDPEATLVDNLHETSHRVLTARDIVLRRCDQTDAIPFDECYPDSALKNCRKIGEGVYGEVFLWRARDGQARVLKVIPVGGNIKVNGEHQKDFGEIISEIVIAMELSALRTPIAEIEQHIDEGKNIEALDLHSVANATDVFNKVIAVRCVYGSYPSRLLDLWELYDETKGSENDNPATLPEDQQYIVLELANAGQDLESYQFANAEQAYSIFKQVAYGLAVAEEALQFEHRDLHWGNVLIQPTDEKYATFVLRGRSYSVARRGVAATVIDYSLSRVALRGARSAALYHDLAADEELFNGRGDYQFELYRLMRRALGNNWENYEPYTNVLWLHYTIDKMITALRYTRTNTKVHKHNIAKLSILKDQLLNYRSATEFVLTHNEL